MTNRFLSLFFPLRCTGCARYGTALCEKCLDSIPLSPYIDTHGVVGIYDYGNRIVRSAITRFKYRKQSEAIVSLVRAALPHIHACIAESTHATSTLSLTILPIPIHTTRERERGFNQSAIIAHTIARSLNALFDTTTLTKIRATESQTHMHNKKARLKNMHGSMYASTCNKKTFYIVVDDVATTTATCIEAKRALQVAGARHVLCIALAHGRTR